MGYLSNNDFFTKLSSLFDSCRNVDHGSIYLTQKRLTYNVGEEMEPSNSSQFNDLKVEKSLPILIRASNGKSKGKKDQKIKLSTVVEADGLEEFFTRYAEVCKSGMNKMKKRDRSKAKEKLKARKKQNAISASTLELKKV